MTLDIYNTVKSEKPKCLEVNTSNYCVRQPEGEMNTNVWDAAGAVLEETHSFTQL